MGGPCELEVIFASREAKEDFAGRCETNWPCKQACPEGAAAACPEDWLYAGGGICAAPSYYKSPGCPLLPNFLGWTADMKTNFSDECSVRWPCNEDISKADTDCHSLDVSGCPSQWRQKGFFCEPPADVRGQCDKPMRLSEMTPEQKIRWGGDCGVQWPCVGGSGKHAEDRMAARSGVRVATSDSGPVGGDG